MTKKTGQEVAEVLSNFANGATQKDKEMFVEAVVTDHKTLQEDTFIMFLNCMKQWAEMNRNGNFDARNEYTCKASAVMIQALKENNLL